jgi:hypothetical protein
MPATITAPGAIKRKAKKEGEKDAHLEPFWVCPEFRPTTVLLRNEFMADFVKKKGRADRHKHHRH